LDTISNASAIELLEPRDSDIMPSISLQAMLSSLASKTAGSGEMNGTNVAIVFAAVICVLAPLDVSQLCFALFGAVAYATLQAFTPRQPKTHCQLAVERDHREQKRERRKSSPREGQGSTIPRGSPTRPQQWRKPQDSNHCLPVQPLIKPEVYQPSSVPVVAPTFESTGWEAEVRELLSQITPGASEDQAVQRLVLHVKKAIQSLFGDVEVTGFAHGSVNKGKAFGVAVPEVDIVANISPVVLAQVFQSKRGNQSDLKKLHKSAIRTCTDRLVSAGGLKFRRSAFRGEEPRVTLLVPASLGFFDEAVPIDFSINAVTPFYNAALLTECGQIEPRAKALILLVRRWAKDRGICHAAKGHLSPYLWSLLVMYFMQVGIEDEGSLLPALEAFEISSNLLTSGACKVKSKASSPRYDNNATRVDDMAKLSVGQLFCKFVEFYSRHFNWTKEAVSIRLGKRAAPSVSLPLHIIVREDGSNESVVGPTIEDPFSVGSNLGTCMNAVSLTRLHSELARARQLCTDDSSLTKLLEPWVPVEEVTEQQDDNVISGSNSGEHQASVVHPWSKAARAKVPSLSPRCQGA
jgi:hypothetical protein